MTLSAATMSRKRPSPGSSAPIQIASASPTSNNVQAGYLNPPHNPPSSSATISGNGVVATAGPYIINGAGGVTSSPGSSVETSDLYNLANSSRLPTAATSLALNDSNQVARIPNRNNQLMRLTPNTYYQGPGPTATDLGNSAQALGNGGGLSGNGGGSGGGGGADLESIYGELAPMIRKAKSKKANIPPFVQKLSQFVNDPKCDHLIRWSPSGTSFLVLDEDEFSKTLIPDLFKHNNYASFVRQLNMYGFHKVVGLADGSLKTSEQRSKPPSEYKNDFFIRGMPDLMWLIQKPKNTTKRSKGRKKGKIEDSDEDGGSDREVMTSSGIIDDSGQIQSSGGGYIEAPPSQVQPTISKNQVEQILQQLEQLRTHQQIMTSAINRLRKDHTQLYEQSIAFQTLHDRHETSISAILTFLATVYDKSLAGSLNSQTLQHLFQGAVDSSQNAGQVMGSPGNAMANVGRAGVVGATGGQQRTFRRRQLMLPPAPHANGSISGVPKDQSGSQNQQQQSPESPGGFNSYQSPSIQEVFTPTTGQLSSAPNSPQQSHSHLNPGFFSPNIFSLAGRHDNNMNSQALTPRLLHRAITPLLQAAEQQRSFASQHNKQVVETHNGIEQINALQEQQNDGISKLMEIVGPYATSTSKTTPIHPISSIPTSPHTSTIGATTITPVAIAAVSPAAAAKEEVTTDDPSAPTAPATAGGEPAESVEDVVNANIDTLLPRQTPSPTITSNYVNAPPPPLSNVGIGIATSPEDTVGLGAGEPADFDVDIDQFLDTEWLPQDGFQTIVEDPVADASQSLSEVSLDQSLFMDDQSYGQGFLQGGLHGIESMMGGGTIGASSAALDSIGQILGTNPSTTAGSPHSPAFSDGTASLIDGGGIGGLEGDLTGSAKKKRRTG